MAAILQRGFCEKSAMGKVEIIEEIVMKQCRKMA